MEWLHTCVEGAGLFCVTIAEFGSLTAWEKWVIYFIEYDSRFWHMLAVRTARLYTCRHFCMSQRTSSSACIHETPSMNTEYWVSRLLPEIQRLVSKSMLGRSHKTGFSCKCSHSKSERAIRNLRHFSIRADCVAGE